MKEINKKRRRTSRFALFFNILSAVLLGYFGMYSRKLGLPIVNSAISRDICSVSFSWGDAGFMALLSALLFAAIRGLSRLNGRMASEDCHARSDGKSIFLLSAVFLLAWSPYMLTYYPGTVEGDSISSVIQVTTLSFSNHHPVLFSVFMGVFFAIGHFFGNNNLGVFLFSFVQSAIMAVAISTLICWMFNIGMKRWLLVICALFYSFFPAFPVYGITMWKDPLFSVSLLFLSIYLYRSNTGLAPRKLLLAFLLLWVSFARNNGIFVAVIVLIAFLIAKKKKSAIVAAVSVIAYFVITGPVYNCLDIYSPKTEALAIPLQQISCVVATDGSSLTEAEIEEIEKIMPVDCIKENYDCTCVDRIKFNASFNSVYVETHPASVLKLWLKLLPGHFKTYVRAYMAETLGFWHPYVQSVSFGYIDRYIAENYFGIKGCDLFEKFFGISIKKQLDGFTPVIGSGSLAWIMIISANVCVAKGQNKKLWFYLPGFLNWVTIMIATPVAFSLRYVFVLLLLMPAYVLLPFINEKSSMQSMKLSSTP